MKSQCVNVFADKWRCSIPCCYTSILKACSNTFGAVNKSLKGQVFTCDKDVEDTVENCALQQPRLFYTEAINSLSKGRDQSYNVYGNFI